mgnify:CR=1 FL=1
MSVVRFTFQFKNPSVHQHYVPLWKYATLDLSGMLTADVLSSRKSSVIIKITT